MIYRYCHDLAIKAGNMLATLWDTSLLVPEESSGYMVNVILPSTDADAISNMQSILDSTYHMYIVCSSVPNANSNGDVIYFTRLSAQVYLQMTDFILLGQLIPQLLSEYRNKI